MENYFPEQPTWLGRLNGIHSCVSNVWSTFFFVSLPIPCYVAWFEKDKHVYFSSIFFFDFGFPDERCYKNKMSEEKNKQRVGEKEKKQGTEKESDTEWKIYKTRAQQQ